MGRKVKFTDSELKYEAGQVLRHIKNEVRNGRMGMPNKTTCFKLLSMRSKIGIGTYRTLWAGKRKEYLDIWYTRVVNEVEQILIEINNKSFKDESTEYNSIQLSIESKQLREHIKRLNQVIREKDKRIEALTIENQTLRTKNLKMFSQLDLF